MKVDTLESSLTESLEELQKTQNVAAVLDRYGDQAAPLRPLLETAQWLGDYYAVVPQPTDGLRKGREHLLMSAALQRATLPTRYPGRQGLIRPNGLWWKFVGVMVALALVLVPLRGTLVSAASSTLPGNPLYSLKLSSEDRLFASIKDAEVKVVLAMSLAHERIEEVGALVQKQQAIPSDVLYRMDYLFRTALMSAAWAGEPIMLDMLAYIIHHARQQVQELELLKLQATPINLDMLNALQTLCLKTQIVAMVALKNPGTFREAYQAGMPEKLPLPSGGPLSGIIVTDELKELATSVPTSSPLTVIPVVPFLTPTAQPTPSPGSDF